MTPLISIVTVCFNSERTLRETLESVAMQDFAGYEHLVWDGNSTDGTPVILGKFVSPHLRLFRGADDGIYDAMTKAVALARGQYVIFLNSDDVLACTDSLSTIAAACRTQADLVCWDISYFGSTGRLARSGVWHSPRHYPRAARFAVVPPHPGTAVKRQLLNQLEGFSIRYKISGDFDFFLRLSKLSPSTAFIARPLVNMRIGGASTGSVWNILRGLGEATRSAYDAFGLLAVFALFKPLYKLSQFSNKSKKPF